LIARVRLGNKRESTSRTPLSPLGGTLPLPTRVPAAAPRCANGLHYRGHAVTLMSSTVTPRMQNAT